MKSFLITAICFIARPFVVNLHYRLKNDSGNLCLTLQLEMRPNVWSELEF